MKLGSIRNLFEFQDNSYEEILNNLLNNQSQIKGLGPLDICIICRKNTQGIISHSNHYSTFHFVRGLCPNSQAEISAYIQSLLQSQELQVIKLFQTTYIIVKIIYITYDIFSKTIIVTIFEIFDFPEQSINCKTIGFQQNNQQVCLTKSHWDGVYVSNVLREIDFNLKMMSAGKCFNSRSLSNENKIKYFINLTFALLQEKDQEFQDLNYITSNTHFPLIKELIYYLNYPLYTLFEYLRQTSQLEILLQYIEQLNQNVILILIKCVIQYKLKQYESCYQNLQNIQKRKINLVLVHYFQAKVLMKLAQYEKAYSLLQSLLIVNYENQIIWITLAKLFRKIDQPQISLFLINQAANFEKYVFIKKNLSEIEINNYKLLINEQKKLQNLSLFDTHFKINSPLVANELTCYTQLSGNLNQRTLLIRLRQQGKKELKKFESGIVKNINKHEFKVSQQIIDQIMNSEIFTNDENISCLEKEIINLINQIGIKKIQIISNTLFGQNQNKSSTFDDKNYFDKDHFSIMQKKHQSHILNNSHTELRFNSMNSDSDEEQDIPPFLKQQQNRSFNISNKKKNKRKFSLSPIKQSLKLKDSIPSSIILENLFESLETEGNEQHKIPKLIRTITQTLQSIPNQNQKCVKQKILGFEEILKIDIKQSTYALFVEQLNKRRVIMNNQFKATFDKIILLYQQLDNEFYSKVVIKNQSPQKSKSDNQTTTIQSQIFLKSNLKNSMQNEQKIQLKEFYFLPTFQFDDNQNNILSYLKSESSFLYKCSRIALNFKKNQLALLLLEQIHQKVISISVQKLLLKLYENNEQLLIKHIEMIINDFNNECKINQIDYLPLWIEIHLINAIRRKGSQYMLCQLTKLDSHNVFQLIKKTILEYDNIL